MAAAHQSIIDAVDMSSSPVVETHAAGDAPAKEPVGLDAVLHAALDWSIFAVMTGILLFVIWLLNYYLGVQTQHYRECLDSALHPQADYAAALAYAHYSDVAVIKMSALFLGFVLIFAGALYVLRNATSQFKLQFEDPKSSGRSGSLETSSPGLVVVTLGVVLSGMALMSTHDTELTSGAPAPDPIQAGAAVTVPSQPNLTLEK